MRQFREADSREENYQCSLRFLQILGHEKTICIIAKLIFYSKNTQLEKQDHACIELYNFEHRELAKLSAVQFMQVWEHYDEDGKFGFRSEILFSKLCFIISKIYLYLMFSKMSTYVLKYRLRVGI